MTIRNDLVHPASPTKRYKLTRVRAAYTAKVDELVACQTSAGAITVTLPAAPSTGACIAIGDDDDAAATNAITVASSATIDGAASVTISSNGGLEQFIFDGTKWSRIVSDSLIAGPSDITVALLKRLRLALGVSGGAPAYYPIDANDQLVWRFQETLPAADSTAPFTVANLGAAGSALDGLSGGTLNCRSGVNDGHFGKAMIAAAGSNVGFNVRSPAQTPGWSAFTIASWVNFNRYVGSGNFGRVFFKNANAGAWSNPFSNACLQFEGTTGDLHAIVQNFIGGSHRATALGQRSSFMLNRTNHVGFSYSDADHTIRLYVNGLLAASNTIGVPFSVDLGAGEWQFGDTWSANIENPGGFWQEARVCNVARDEAWFAAVYAAGMGR